MKIAVLPYSRRKQRKLARLPLSDLYWPDGAVVPEGVVGDLGPDDHLIIYASSYLLYRPMIGVRCQLSVIIPEPFAIQWRDYISMRWLWRRYFLIFTHNRALARAVPNVRFLPGADPMVTEPSGGVQKTARMSLIASSKASLEGHKLRHRMADWIRREKADVALLGRAYQALEDKKDGLEPFLFSVVIENCREPGYFTEKLIDCLLCDTIPIYWGAPDIAEFFDTRGMVICENEAELRDAVLRLGEGDYERLIPFGRQNRERARQYLDPRGAATRIVAEEVATRR